MVRLVGDLFMNKFQEEEVELSKSDKLEIEKFEQEKKELDEDLKNLMYFNIETAMKDPVLEVIS